MATRSEVNQPAPDDHGSPTFTTKAFGDVVGFLNVCMCVLGDRLGLFKELATNGPATTSELAERTGIQDRYAREWLSQMTCAEYLSYDPPSQRFRLPDAHQAVLAAEGHPEFLGGIYQNFQSIEQGLFSKLLRAFRDGSGIPYADYDDNYWEGLERALMPLYTNELVGRYIPALPDVQAALERGALIADIGCGRGTALIALAQAFPRSRFVGYDAVEPNIARAQANAQRAGVADQVQFIHHDTMDGLPERYDVIMSFDSLHHAVKVVQMLHVIREALQPAGMYVCSEPACANSIEENIGPGGAMLYASGVLVCVPTVRADGGEGLGAAGLPEAKMRDLCDQVGFTHVRLVPWEGASKNVYEIRP